MNFKFTYLVNKKIHNIIQKYNDREDAVDGFWKIKKVKQAKENGNRVMLVNIKRLEH